MNTLPFTHFPLFLGCFFSSISLHSMWSLIISGFYDLKVEPTRFVIIVLNVSDEALRPSIWQRVGKWWLTEIRFKFL